MNKQDIKEKLILIAITTGVFLPVRVLFATFISEHWLGSLGLVSIFGFGFLYLIKKNKVGWFGTIFERQMKKSIAGKTGKYVIGISILFLIYFGSSLYFMDRGSTIFNEDKEIFYNSFIINEDYTIQNLPIDKLKGPNTMPGFEVYNWILKLDYALSIAFSIMNDATDGWLSHFVVVIFVEQLEILAIVFIYRRTYKKPVSINSEK